MEKFSYPLIDYRTFLSDTGTGIITLVSMVTIIIKGHAYMECNSPIITEIYNTFSAIKIDEILANVIPANAILIILVSILIIAPLIGFIINATSYIFLNWFLKKISDNYSFNYFLKSIGVKNYLTTEFDSEDIKNIEDIKFFQKFDIHKFNEKTKKNNFFYSIFFDDARIYLGAITSKYSISQYDRILGGLNMCRNCTFIIIIDLYLTLYIFYYSYFLAAIVLSIIFYFVLRLSLIKKLNEHILAAFLLYLILLPFITYIIIYIEYNFAKYFIFEILFLTEFFLFFTIFLSGFFIVYNNYDIYKCLKIYLNNYEIQNECINPPYIQ